MIRFHLDEHIDPAIASALRHRGIDVTTAVDANLISAPDLSHLEHATQSHRVIVTRDHDFEKIHRAGTQHAGIIVITNRRTLGEIVRFLALSFEVMSAEDMQGQIEYF